MLLAWIPVESPLETTAAARRTKDMSKLTWASVSTILVDEHITLKARSGGGAALSESGGRHGRRNRNNSKKHGTEAITPPTVAAMTTKRRLLRGRWLRGARWKAAAVPLSASFATSLATSLGIASSTRTIPPTNCRPRCSNVSLLLKAKHRLLAKTRRPGQSRPGWSLHALMCAPQM
jgi:hypothetical protein